MLGGKRFPYRTLPGGRRVRDYIGLTAAQLIAQVGDSPQAAEVALEQELDSAKPRKTVVEALEKVSDNG